MKYIKINFALCAIEYFFRFFFQKTKSAGIVKGGNRSE